MSRALNLYRNILREHRKLPAAMRLIGDDYVRNEFKLHKVTTSTQHLNSFFTGWMSYLSALRDQRKAGSKIGRHLSPEEERHLSAEQQEKVKQIRTETKSTFNA